MQEQNFLDLNKQGEGQVLTEEPLISAGIAGSSLSETSSHSTNFGENTMNNGSGGQFSESFISSAQANTTMAGKASETALLDERSLLACIVRTVPAGGRIRINSTVSLLLINLEDCFSFASPSRVDHNLLDYSFLTGWEKCLPLCIGMTTRKHMESLMTLLLVTQK